MPTYSNTDSRALRSGAVEPRNVPPARRRPGAGGVAVDRKDITGIVTHCRFVAQEYAAMRIFVKNPYQIYQLNNTAKKYTDELLSLLFQKFSGDLSEISRVANKLSLAHKTLSTRFTGAAAGIPFYKGGEELRHQLRAP